MILNAIGSRVWRGAETAAMSSTEMLAAAHCLVGVNALGAQEDLLALVLLVDAGTVERDVPGPDASRGVDTSSGLDVSNLGMSKRL